MILDRLLVREKLSLLVVVPLVMVAMLLVPLLAGRLDEARLSSATARTADTARETGELVEGVQRARLLAVAYLAAPGVRPNDLVVALQQVEADRSRLAQDAPAALDEALDAVAALGPYGDRVVARAVSGEEAVAVFGAAVDGLVDALGLARSTQGRPQDVAALGALDALLRANEAAGRGGALLLLAPAAGAGRQAELLAQVRDLDARARALGDQFSRSADATAAGLFRQATTGAGRQRLDAAVARLAAGDRVPGARTGSASADVFAAVRSQTGLRQLVQARVTQDVAVSAQDAAGTARLVVVVLAGVAAIVLGLVIGLTVVVGRSVSRPLRRLTLAAGRVADLTQEELLRVADEDAETAAVPRLSAIDLRSADEIGDLAQAFNRVQATAALLLERQVVGRRNVAAMFAGVGRRTTNLVGRQLALIDRLERTEQDPGTLETLYRLDHMTSRLRRNASSLVVLSGSSEAAGESRPVALADAIRGALGTVEDFHRVQLGRLPAVFVAPGAAPDVMLLLAELMENAVQFSPPRSTVEVAAEPDEAGGCVLRISDTGLGMPPERLAAENVRLKRRERLDLAPTDVLGLFVVGRIARRHGIDVRLEPGDGAGTTAVVGLPAPLLVESVAGASVPAEARRARGAVRGRTRRPVPAGAGPVAAPAGGPGEEPPSAEDLVAARARRRAERRAAARAGRDAAQAVEAAEAAPALHAEVTPPAGVDLSGVPRRVPGAHLGRTGVEATAPVARSGTVDADRVRGDLDDLEQAVARAGQDHAREVAPPPPPPPPPPTGPVPGVRRRVPGRALDALDTGVAAAPVGQPAAVDAEEVRQSLQDVVSAVDRALVQPPRETVGTQRQRENGTAPVVPRHVRRPVPPEEPPQQEPPPDAPPQQEAPRAEPEQQEPPQDAPPPDAPAPEPTAPPTGLVRRVAGAALAALEAEEAARVEAVQRRREAVAAEPEDPAAVRVWADDVEAALARADEALAGPGDGPAGAGNADHGADQAADAGGEQR